MVLFTGGLMMASLFLQIKDSGLIMAENGKETNFPRANRQKNMAQN